MKKDSLSVTAAYRLLTIRKHLRLKLMGAKRYNRRAYAQARGVVGFGGNEEWTLLQLERYMRRMGILPPEVHYAAAPEGPKEDGGPQAGTQVQSLRGHRQGFPGRPLCPVPS